MQLFLNCLKWVSSFRIHRFKWFEWLEDEPLPVWHPFLPGRMWAGSVSSHTLYWGFFQRNSAEQPKLPHIHQKINGKDLWKCTNQALLPCRISLHYEAKKVYKPISCDSVVIRINFRHNIAKNKRKGRISKCFSCKVNILINLNNFYTFEASECGINFTKISSGIKMLY